MGFGWDLFGGVSGSKCFFCFSLLVGLVGLRAFLGHWSADLLGAEDGWPLPKMGQFGEGCCV